MLSNWSPRMLEDALGRSGLRGVVRPLSTDSLRTYKPDPRAYALALDAFALDRSRIQFVAFAGWDAAGAAWFGFPTVWMNRAGEPPRAARSARRRRRELVRRPAPDATGLMRPT